MTWNLPQSFVKTAHCSSRLEKCWYAKETKQNKKNKKNKKKKKKKVKEKKNTVNFELFFSKKSFVGSSVIQTWLICTWLMMVKLLKNAEVNSMCDFGWQWNQNLISCKSCIPDQQYFLIAFLYFSWSGKLLAIEVWRRPQADKLLVF